MFISEEEKSFIPETLNLSTCPDTSLNKQKATEEEEEEKGKE